MAGSFIVLVVVVALAVLALLYSIWRRDNAELRHSLGTITALFILPNAPSMSLEGPGFLHYSPAMFLVSLRLDGETEELNAEVNIDTYSRLTIGAHISVQYLVFPDSLRKVVKISNLTYL